MKLKDVKNLTEMARTAAVCANCGRTKTQGHYYYQGQFRCKGMPGKAFTAGGTAASAGAPTPGETAVEDSPDAMAAAQSAEKTGAIPPVPKYGSGAAPTTAPASSADATQAALKKWLASHNVEDYTIEANGIIDVQGAVRLDNMRMPKMPGPVQFGTVTGDFICSSTGLTSLRGCPQHVGTDEFGGDFMCDFNDMDSLEGGPSTVGGTYSCTGCENLTSLNHLATNIGGSILAKDLPKVKDLHHIHKVVRQCGEVFDLSGTKLESSVLGLVMIKGLQSVKLENTKVADIINKYLKEADRNVHECQEELIDAGFAAFAKL